MGNEWAADKRMGAAVAQLREDAMHVTFGQAAVWTAAALAVIGLALALVTPAGRERMAWLGLRVADALIVLLERLLSEQKRAERRAGR